MAANILSLYINKKVADSDVRNQSFLLMPKNKFYQFIKKLRKPHLTPDYYRWQHYKKNTHAIKQNTRLIFKVIDFQTKSAPLEKDIIFLKKNFTHILPRYSKNHQADEASISACIVAKATGSDVYLMKDISDIKEHSLHFTYNNFIRFQTLSLASNSITNKVATLPIFNEYTLTDYGIHASVDGQKLETKYNTIKARYSRKYYGSGQGVSAYCLFANCVPLCTKIIGANEHESHYLLDILKSNNSDVVISAVSGDMHSINRVNFALLYMFDYRFMPRFTKLDKKANSNMVSFDHLNKHKDYIVKPSKQVNKGLIIKESDNILRILATIP